MSPPGRGRAVVAWLVACGHGASRPFAESNPQGQGLVEYGLILALMALVTVVALVFFGGVLATALSLIGQAIDSST